MIKLTAENINVQAERVAGDPVTCYVAMASVYAMLGGGLLSSSAINQPDNFYIDDRVGKLPYAKREIMQAVNILAAAKRIMYRRHGNNADWETRVAEFRRGSMNLGVF